MSRERELRDQADRALAKAQKIRNRGLVDGWTDEREEAFERAIAQAELLLDEAQEAEGRDRIVGPRSSRGFETDDFNGGGDMTFEVSDELPSFGGSGRTLGENTKGQEVRAFRAGDSIFRYKADREGWDVDFWTEVENPFGKLLRARAVGPSDAWERRALSSTAGGGDLIPDPIRATVLDDLKAQSFLGRAGASFVDMDSASLTISRVASAASHSWTPEGSTAGSTAMSFDAISLDAKTLRGIHSANRELVDDAPDFPGVLERELRGSLNAELERTALVGSSTAGEPTGLLNSTDVTSLNFGGTTSGAAVSSSGAAWGEILRAREQLLTSNVADDGHSYVWSPRVERQFAELKDANHQPLQAPQALQGVSRYVTSNAPSTLAPGGLTAQSALYYGRYRDLIVGMRLDPQVELLTERFATNYRFGWLSFLRADIAVQRPESFVTLERIST